MERFWIALIAGLVGGAGGGLAVHYLVPRETARTRSDDTAAALRDLKDAVSALERRLAPPPDALEPGLAATPALPTPVPATGDGAGPAASRMPATREELKALIAEATKVALEEKAAKDAADLKKLTEKKKVTLSEAATELNLSASQETEIRLAYQEATDKMLKLLAEPEKSPEDLRRELTEAKGDKAKQTGMMMAYLPKIFGKLGDFMAIDVAKKARITKAVGEEKAKALEAYKIQDEDPFDLDEGLTFTTGD